MSAKKSQRQLMAQLEEVVLEYMDAEVKIRGLYVQLDDRAISMIRHTMSDEQYDALTKAVNK